MKITWYNNVIYGPRRAASKRYERITEQKTPKNRLQEVDFINFQAIFTGENVKMTSKKVYLSVLLNNGSSGFSTRKESPKI